MKAGFIGAGKVGFSLGKYLSDGGMILTGYYSRNPESSQKAAEFTESKFYESLEDIVKDSDTLFITVPDGEIAGIWNNLRNLTIENKNICHCSGSISSTVFFDAENKGGFRYSVHPLYAVKDKYTAYKGLSEAYFAIEGSEEHLQELVDCFSALGNNVIKIDTEKKTLYHCAAVMVSNQMAALADIGAQLLEKCGFDRDAAIRALAPLMLGNIQSVINDGPVKALTGPVERGDFSTVKAHVDALDESGEALTSQIYALLTCRLAELAQRKHPEKDYSKLNEYLSEMNSQMRRKENEKHS